MAATQTPRKVISLIAPTDDEFDASTGRKGRKDVTSPVLNDLLAQAEKAGLSTFQIPDGAEFTDESGKDHSLNVNKVRAWAKKHNDDDENNTRISVGGGNGKNISVTVVAKDEAKDEK